MNRYFAQIQYRGSNYAGWQLQPNAMTVQEQLETYISKLTRIETKIMGCGRTDSGVHASDYYFHFDVKEDLGDQFVFKMNMMLPKDIAIRQVFPVHSKAHSRFDAVQRSYQYHIHRDKNPFKIGLSYHFPHLFTFEIEKLNEMAAVFLEYEDFFPFCKSNTDVKTTICNLLKSHWEVDNDKLVYHVSANRFLRGMVRLMVGCCINFSQEKIAIAEVRRAFMNRERLKKDLSVPAEGLFLSMIKYPDSIHKEGSRSYID